MAKARKNKSQKANKDIFKWEVLDKLRVEVIRTIGSSHVGIVDLVSQNLSILEGNKDLKSMVEGLNKTYEDLIFRALEIARQHLVSGDPTNGTGVYQKGKVEDDYLSTSKFAKIYNEYMEIQHAAIDVTTKSFTEISIAIAAATGDKDLKEKVESETSAMKEAITDLGKSVDSLSELRKSISGDENERSEQ